MMTLDDIREVLRESFHVAAEWRRRKAQEDPDDNRHIEAAAILERLAESVTCVADDILSAYGEHLVGPAESFDEAEIHNEALREIGFHTQPENAEAFVKGYLRQMTNFTNEDASQMNYGHMR
jgi:hypothetical protein